MLMDLDQWHERSAIMQFDGGLSRFQAETLAAEAQGKRRFDFVNADRQRNIEAARNNRQEPTRQPENGLPRVQPNKEKAKRPMFERHVQA